MSWIAWRPPHAGAKHPPGAGHHVDRQSGEPGKAKASTFRNAALASQNLGNSDDPRIKPPAIDREEAAHGSPSGANSASGRHLFNLVEQPAP
jgi:hypothetical protein